MAHHKSAKKRIRRNNATYERNRAYLATVRTSIKGFKNAVFSEEKAAKLEDLKPMFIKAQVLLAKASSKGIVPKKTASRKISRMAMMLKKFESKKS